MMLSDRFFLFTQRALKAFPRTRLMFTALYVAAALTVLPFSASGASFAPSPPADSDPWQTEISNHSAIPPRIVAVDKKRQQLFLFERHSPLRLKDTFICSTGQNPGDKQTRGDLKTPEGVYFVVQHLTSGLDYLLYGSEAYTLNYPNPVDKVRGKTGYGIWIHGRGETLTPLQTQGCVAMNNGDLASLGKTLAPGTPVLLTNAFSQTQSASPQDAETVGILEKKVQAWSKAWAQRSPAMFDFYDPDAYSVAQGEPFSRFKAQKERLFKSLDWIKTSVRDIHVLQGPGYWVTWFHQDYSASNLSTKGVRRLYWTKNDKGEYRILGMEWEPGISSGTLVADAEPAIPPRDASPVSEEQVLPLVGSSAKTSGSASGRADERGADDGQPPVGTGMEAAAASDSPQASPIATAERSAAKPAKSKAAEPERTQPQNADPERTQPKKNAAPEKAAAPSREETVKAIAGRIEAWRLAWAKGDLNAYIKFYAPDAVQGGRKSAASIRRQKEELWSRRAPASVALNGIRIEVQSETKARADMLQQYKDKGGDKDSGVKTLHLRKMQGVWLIVREDWSSSKDETRN